MKSDSADLPQLETFDVGESSLRSLKDLVISSRFIQADLVDLPQLKTFIAGVNSFHDAVNVTLSGVLWTG